MKGNLISDILQGNPIPPLVFAEQVANGLAIIWDLDGKQRCTTAYSFSKDAFKITKNIRRWLIAYQTSVKGKDGTEIGRSRRICDEFIKDNATAEDFDSFEDLVERITRAGTEETFNMFDSKDSFMWFGLFARFVKTGFDDSRFIEFMAEFSRSLHRREINGKSFDDLNGKATKDKAVVLNKD